MSPLRCRMIEDMQIRNLTANTQLVHVSHVVRFAGFVAIIRSGWAKLVGWRELNMPASRLAQMRTQLARRG
jgi:hypothetical protein